MADSLNVIILEPLRVLRSLNDDQFEHMIEEWQSYYKGKKYTRVEKMGGAGDKGRDIRCTGGVLNDLYIFQAKNYNHKLGKKDVFPDIAKCCFYSFRGYYQVPREFTFVSPLGVSPDVSDIFADKARLKQEVKDNWNKMCASKITKPDRILLEGDLLTYVDNFNFSIFNYLTPQEIIDGVKETNCYAMYFGQLNKARPLSETPPEQIAEKELVYTGKIVEAYADYLGEPIDIAKIKEAYPELWADFKRHRDYFYNAESLQRFSRDIYTPESQWFEAVKNEVYHAIINYVKADAKHGFERLTNVMNCVNPLSVVICNMPVSIPVQLPDRRGVCHHLANEREDIRWKK
jgi:hypothetical protein